MLGISLCPKCNSDDITHYQGYKSKDRTEPDEPEGFNCRDCDHFWGQEDDPDGELERIQARMLYDN